jgi:hypothetical protein
MASIITATTSSGLTQSADNSGVLQLASGTGNLVTVPSVTGTAMVSGNMPAFSAYQTGNTNISSAVATKLTFNVESFDTASCYDTTNSRFTPNVAGYYQINANAHFDVTNGTTGLGWIYKNGSAWKRGVQISLTSGNFGTFESLISCIVYLNGTTDYVEVYGYCAGTSPSMGGDRWFDGCLVRAA